MSAPELERFLGALERDSGLRQKVEAAGKGAVDSFAAIAGVATHDGYGITGEELKRAIESSAAGGDRELSEDDLDKVAGGIGETIEHSEGIMRIRRAIGISIIGERSNIIG